MARAPIWPRPAAIWLYYQRSQVALLALRTETNRSPVRLTSDPFFGLTPVECEATLSGMRDELDDQVTLALVASFEASFQTDFAHRARKARLKDPVSRACRTLATKYRERVRFEDILDVWKEATGQRQVFGHFAQLLNYRHWLAHGRYWVHKSGSDFDPGDAWEIGQRLIQQLPPEFPLP